MGPFWDHFGACLCSCSPSRFDYCGQGRISTLYTLSFLVGLLKERVLRNCEVRKEDTREESGVEGFKFWFTQNWGPSIYPCKYCNSLVSGPPRKEQFLGNFPFGAKQHRPQEPVSARTAPEGSGISLAGIASWKIRFDQRLRLLLIICSSSVTPVPMISSVSSGNA